MTPVPLMYMRRPTIPEPIFQAVKDEANEYDNSWHQTLERVLQQKTDIEIKKLQEVEA